MIVQGANGSRENRNLTYFDCQIKLYEPRVFSFNDSIQGQVYIHTGTKVHFKCVRVQLEGTTKYRYQSEVESTLTSHTKVEKFFPSSEHKTFDEDGACFYVIGGKSKKEDTKSLPRGEHIFPFQLQLGGASFPSTFLSRSGSVDYRLAVHTTSRRDDDTLKWTQSVPQSISINLKGYLNLTSNPAYLEPLVATQKKFKSLHFFSKAPLLKVSLVLKQIGLLPNSRVPCQVVVENNTTENVTFIQVELLQKLNFYTEESVKEPHSSVSNVLDSAQKFLNQVETEVSTELFLHVPMNSVPTFTLGSRFIEILYLLQVTVKTANGLQVEKSAGVVVGTENKEPIIAGLVDSNKNSKESLSLPGCPSPPPSYSSLTSRSPVKSPMDPMPPPPSYKKAVGIEDWEKFNPFQPR